jgi:DNA-binding transcriptional ArsR family regulator
MPRRRTSAAASSSTAARLRPHARSAATLLKALANEQRLMILCNLTEGELSVGELNERLPLSQSALSQHLAVLREQGIVATRREAQVIRYSLQTGAAAQVVGLLHDIYCGTSRR